MILQGEAEVMRNLERWYSGAQAGAARAMQNIAVLLENYAKAHHGTTPRAAGWVYPHGKDAGTRRWRPAGIGWGDVTSATQQQTRGFVSRVTQNEIEVVLTAGTEYAPKLELARNGRWAWLWPAVEANRGRMVAEVTERIGSEAGARLSGAMRARFDSGEVETSGGF